MFAANRQVPATEPPAESAAPAADDDTRNRVSARNSVSAPADSTAAPAARPAARPKVRHKRYPLMNHLSGEQVGLFRTVANTYIPDMYDPAAVEVLLVLLEVGHILDLTPTVLERIFGTRVLVALETWGDLVPPRRRPGLIRRAWVWLPNETRPRLYPLAEDGTIHLHEA